MDDVFKVALIVFTVIFGVAIIAAINDSKDQDDLERGQITISQFCDKYKYDNSAPLVCYKYFSAQQVGVRQQGKMTVPVLAPIPE